MKNDLTIFDVPAKLEPIETATILGKEFVIYGTAQNPWFKAKDVAEWIEYDTSSINKLISSVDEDEAARRNLPSSSGAKETWFLSENGVYEVLMQSRKPVAKEFKKELEDNSLSIDCLTDGGDSFSDIMYLDEENNIQYGY